MRSLVALLACLTGLFVTAASVAGPVSTGTKLASCANCDFCDGPCYPGCCPFACCADCAPGAIDKSDAAAISTTKIAAETACAACEFCGDEPCYPGCCPFACCADCAPGAASAAKTCCKVTE